ncbi:cytochrome c [Membranicola marinus]|uniref:Cytochrome c n=1 Tax=Membranihabitans marinus TaxID=1227546 RepID=A0A953HT14_9BACT|nr:c-type cytochrome [Membranihabitans marinus]MBY5957696.1 cytochrome c [Membranihabitans marinus]
MRGWIYTGVFCFLIGMGAFYPETGMSRLSDEVSVADVVERLSGESNNFRPDMSIPGVSAATGRDLIFNGVADSSPSLLPPRRISKFFTCNACHNSTREDPDLSDINPDDRLQYAIENNLPYLPGSTFWGIVNRIEFYNDDYFKKYGQLVFATRENLREAVQLCATECSQGRLLEDWELESILAYFWELELTLEDIRLSPEETRLLDRALNQPQGQNVKNEALTMLQSKYPLRYSATFLPPPSTKNERMYVTGDPLKGEQLYKLSCQHCHYNQNFSYFLLDNTKMTFKYLYKHIPDYDKKSLYQAIRYGTPPMSGKHAYMPQYTKEKMSPGQINDLVTYIKREAGKF